MKRPSLGLAIGNIMRLTGAALLLVGVGVAGAGCEDDEGGAESSGTECGSAALYESSHDLCEAMDATAVSDEGGDCLCFLGYSWDGAQCVGLSNCACEGADCDKLTENLEECETQHASCGELEVACGSDALYESSHDLCDPMDAVAVGDEQGDCRCFLGYAWDGEQCVALGNCTCEGSDCDKLTETLEECEEQHAACDPPVFTCGSEDLYESSHDLCDPMDAVAVGDEHGDCLCFLGFAWNGSQCVALANCACEGADCDKLTETSEECEAQHEPCD